MDDKVVVMAASDNAPCKKCKYAIGDYRDYHCCKYKVKPIKVLFEGKECENFVKEE